MAKIALGIKDFNLGTKVSQSLTNAGHQVEFIEVINSISSDFDIIIVHADEWEDLVELKESSYIIGYTDKMTRDKLKIWKSIGFNRTILKSSLSKNIAEIVKKIVDEGI